MAYDRAPEDGAELAGRYRVGYTTTSTDQLVGALAGVGCEVWGVVGEGWYWRFGRVAGGPEEAPANAVAMALACLGHLADVLVVAGDGRSTVFGEMKEVLYGRSG